MSTSSSISTTLRPGDQGLSVRQMQENLNRRFEQLNITSLVSVSVDGHFGPETLNAVKYAQCIAGLTVDGIVGPRTLGFIEQGADGLKILRIGSQGSGVVAVQRAILLAQIRIEIDGIFGPDTEARLKRYQTIFSLEADGIVGPKTWDLIVGTRLGGLPCAALLPE